MPNWTHANSGTLATDYYRESKGKEAANVFLAGKGLTLKSGDHNSASELCIEVVARRGQDNTTHSSDATIVNTANAAVNNLNIGNGFHKKQSDHSAGQTCVSVIANATT